MPYQPWQESVPAGTAPANQLDTFIQNLKVQIRERMVSLGVAGWTTDDPVFLDFVQLGGATPHLKGNSATTEISIRDKSGAVKQLVITDAGQATFNVALDVDKKNVRNIPHEVGNITGATTVDWDAGNTKHYRLTGNVTFTFSNPKLGAFYFLRIQQDGSGNRFITWPTTVKFTPDSVTSLSAGANRVDCVGMYYDGTNYIAWFSARNISV